MLMERLIMLKKKLPKKAVVIGMMATMITGCSQEVQTTNVDGLFCTRSEIPPERYSADSCEGEQPEEEKALHPISLIQQEEKDFSLKKRSSLSVTIL